MRRILIALAAFAAVALWGGVATAGEYHAAAQLICSDCHTMHYSQQHPYTGASPATTFTGGPYGHLLRSASDAICLTCHDGQSFAPDVLGNNTGTAYLRQAGALNNASTAGTYESWMGHTLGVSSTIPGGTGSLTLVCASCHAPHGTTNYRNLWSTVTYAKGTNDLTKDVFLRSWTLGSITTNYAVSNVDFNEPDTTQSAIGVMCKGCHTNFHGLTTDANMFNGTDFIRHPTGGANINGPHSSLAQFSAGLQRVKVMSPTGNWGTQGVAFAGAPTTLSPSCFSCHKSHGNKNPFGLIFLARSGGTVSEEGTTTDPAVGIRNLCGQCHTYGN